MRSRLPVYIFAMTMEFLVCCGYLSIAW